MIFAAKKQVLLVGNDGVQLYVVQGKRASLYADYSDSGASLSSDLRAAFKAVNAPLTILFDVVEQQYRKEAIPNVGRFDKKKVIERKMQMAFPQQQMRAFLPLKPTKEGEGITALFAGLSPNLTITQIIDAVIGSEVTIAGAGLLPLESTSLVQKLVDGVYKKIKTGSPSRWAVLMTYHKTGGLRQVVTKDGELSLTRLTPLAIDPNNIQALTDEMAREFNATLTYLSRFGYGSNDSLDLIIVSSEDVCQSLKNARLTSTNLFALTLFEACTTVGFTPTMAHEAGPYSDALHAGWTGLQKKLLVPLSAPTLDKVKQSRQMAQLAMFALIFGLGYVGWQVFNLQTNMITLNHDILDLKAKRITLQNEHDELAKKLNTLKYDAEKTRIILEAFDKLNAGGFDAEPVIALINSAVPREKAQVKEIKVVPFDPTALDNAQAAAAPPPDPNSPDANKPKMQVELTISFIEGVNIEAAAATTNDLVAALKSRLPNWQIGTKDMVGNLAVDKTMKGVSEQVAQGKVEGAAVKQETSTIVMKGVSP
jgi:hypothetical protein